MTLVQLSDLDKRLAARLYKESGSGDVESDAERADEIIIQALRCCGLTKTAMTYKLIKLRK